LKILYFGGQKSGKSSLAEEKAMQLSNEPIYIATYDNSYGDSEMIQRVEKHRNQRRDKFLTIEESFELARVIEPNKTYLIDCLSMWILNLLDEDKLLKQIEIIERVDANIVFVLNDISTSIIPMDFESRKFLDLTGIVGQRVASLCDEVYEVKFGLAKRLK
jgi:adenosylcobinamide kinase/adenosylcobinamide-phosphate guanylyltransferase